MSTTTAKVKAPVTQATERLDFEQLNSDLQVILRHLTAEMSEGEKKSITYKGKRITVLRLQTIQS